MRARKRLRLAVAYLEAVQRNMYCIPEEERTPYARGVTDLGRTLHCLLLLGRYEP